MPVAAVRPLRHRPVAVLWTAGLVANIGTWSQMVAVGARMTGRSRNRTATAGA